MYFCCDISKNSNATDIPLQSSKSNEPFVLNKIRIHSEKSDAKEDLKLTKLY